MMEYEEDKTVEDYLADLTTEKLVPISVIHDEVDVLVSEKILYPLGRKIIRLSELNKIYRVISMGYSKMRFDFEFDKRYGSFLPNNSINVYEERQRRVVEALDLSTQPQTQQEAREIQRKPQETISQPKTPVYYLSNLPQNNIIEILQTMELLPTAETQQIRLIVDIDDIAYTKVINSTHNQIYQIAGKWGLIVNQG